MRAQTTQSRAHKHSSRLMMCGMNEMFGCDLVLLLFKLSELMELRAIKHEFWSWCFLFLFFITFFSHSPFASIFSHILISLSFTPAVSLALQESCWLFSGIHVTPTQWSRRVLGKSSSKHFCSSRTTSTRVLWSTPMALVRLTTKYTMLILKGPPRALLYIPHCLQIYEKNYYIKETSCPLCTHNGLRKLRPLLKLTKQKNRKGECSFVEFYLNLRADSVERQELRKESKRTITVSPLEYNMAILVTCHLGQRFSTFYNVRSTSVC